jgi:hypothetical protein
VPTYSLGAVKPHVKDAAYALGPKHGFTVVYGWGLRAGPSDHPRGLALDFMTRDKARGDALVADLLSNAKGYNVKYIIWYRRIWQDGQWSTYTGTSNPHTDHVHVSFLDTGTLQTSNVGFPNPFDAAGQLLSVFQEINKGFQWITDRQSWIRIGLVLGGGTLALIGLLTILGRTGQAKDTVRAGAEIIGAAGSAKIKGASNA